MAAAAPPTSHGHTGAPIRDVLHEANFNSVLRARGGDGFYVDNVKLPESELYLDQTSPNVTRRATLWRARMAAKTLPKLRVAGSLSLLAGGFGLGWEIGGLVDKYLHLSGDIGGREPTTMETLTWQYVSDATAIGALSSTGPGWIMQTSSYNEFCAPSNCIDDRDGFILRPSWLRTQAQALPIGSAIDVAPAQCGMSQPFHSGGPCKGWFVPEATMEATVIPDAWTDFTGQSVQLTTAPPIETGDTIAPAAAADAVDEDATHATEDFINFILDPGFVTELEMPQCVGSLVALCISQLEDDGHTGTITVTVADFNGADTSKPATAVLTQSVPAFTTLPFDAPLTLHRNPDAEEMPYLIPEPAPGPAGETFEQYLDRLTDLGFVGSYSSTVVTPDSPFADPQRGPDDVVATTPAPGTRVAPDAPVAVKLNPPAEDWPEPGEGGGGGGCNCPTNAVDFGPITEINYGDSFPFGVFVWAADILGVFNVSADAPSWSFDLSDGGVGVDGLAFDIDLEVFDTYMGWIRTLMSWLLWIGALWWFGTRLLGFKNASDPSEAADEADII